MLVAFVLVIGVFGLVSAISAVRPWLAVLFGIDAGSFGVSVASLRGVNPVDIAVLVLAGTAFAGFWPGPARRHPIWMGLAILLPFAGVAVLIATQLAGRSGLMGGGLVLAVLMVLGRETRLLGYLGLGANVLLLAGDFTTTGPQSIPVAVVVLLGFVIMVAWFIWIGIYLLRLPSAVPPGQHT